MDMKEVVAKQRKFYLTGKTKPIAFRIEMLRMLEEALLLYEKDLKRAFVLDLGKCDQEAELTEFMMARHEIHFIIKNLKNWAKPKRVPTPITCAVGTSKIYREPYGVNLILAPWNYPLLLAMGPLIGAIAGGNCAVLKCSRSSAHVTAVIKKMLDATYPHKYIYCADIDCSYDEILEPAYDYVFFTGSKGVGKTIMAKAAENLTPVSLELGGKSPCIIERTADVAYAARRIVWGKFLNGGQTCISIDYILVDKALKDELVYELKKQIVTMYPNPLQDPDYPKIISKRHYDRLCDLIDTEEDVIGGERNPDTNQIAPTILPNATYDSKAMEDEIFGPILPILTYDSKKDVVDKLQGEDKPLAFYLFTKSKGIANQYLNEISFGGGCVNDVILHMVNPNLPFGGAGASGMGAYHGKYTFKTFTREKGVLHKNPRIEIKSIYRPFTKKKMKFINRLIGK